MRYLVTTGLIVLSASLLPSCTKVIDVKLKDSDRKYVIEATLTDAAGDCRVQLSKTKNFSEDNTVSTVSGASVTITDNTTGASALLTELAPGIYADGSFAGVPGHTYKLNVVSSGNTFTAVSTMPAKVNFDTLYMSNDFFFGDSMKFANLEFFDPPSFGNCYQARQYLNGKELKDIFVTNDDYTNGRLNFAKLFTFPDEDEDKAKAGDTIRVDMLCIDPAVYKYWFSLQQSALGNAQSAAPANPVTNIQGGAIGYFTAHTIQTKTVVVE